MIVWFTFNFSIIKYPVAKSEQEQQARLVIPVSSAAPEVGACVLTVSCFVTCQSSPRNWINLRNGKNPCNFFCKTKEICMSRRHSSFPCKSEDNSPFHSREDTLFDKVDNKTFKKLVWNSKIRYIEQGKRCQKWRKPLFV